MIRLGFVGFGRMGVTHFAILNPHPDVQVVGIADPSRPMRSILEKNLDLPLYADHDKLIAEAKPDALVVAPPTRFHAPVVRAALEAGLHCFVEKPLTLSAAESASLAELGERKGLVTQVGYVHRSNEVFLEARRLIAAGALGEIGTFSSRMYGATISKEPAGWRGDAAAGGGCLYEFAAHAIDLVGFLLETPATVGGTAMDRVFSQSTEDLVHATLFLADGRSGTLEVNWADGSYRKPTNQLVFMGTEGHLEVDPYGLALWSRHGREDLGLSPGWNRRYITDLAEPVRFYVRGNAFTNQLDAFVAAVAAGDPSAVPCSFRDAAATDQVIEALRNDAVGEGPSGPMPRRRPEAPRSRRARLRALIRRLLEVLS